MYDVPSLSPLFLAGRVFVSRTQTKERRAIQNDNRFELNGWISCAYTSVYRQFIYFARMFYVCLLILWLIWPVWTDTWMSESMSRYEKQRNDATHKTLWSSSHHSRQMFVQMSNWPKARWFTTVPPSRHANRWMLPAVCVCSATKERQRRCRDIQSLGFRSTLLIQWMKCLWKWETSPLDSAQSTHYTIKWS